MAPKLGEETVPPGEAALLEKLIVQNLALLDEREKPVRRGQHPKQHGCVRAQFIVENLPQDLRHGLFAKPHTFDAVIRFSNGASRDDRKGDAHGMAIKPPRRKLKTRACTFIMPAPVRDAFAGCSTLPDPSISQPWPASPFAPDSAPMMPLFQWAGRRARRQAIPATASPRPLL